MWAWGSPRHLQVKHQGEPLQVVRVLRLGGVGLSKVLGGRGKVAELDVGLGSQGIEFYLWERGPRLPFPSSQSSLRLDTQLPQGLGGPERRGQAGATVRGERGASNCLCPPRPSPSPAGSPGGGRGRRTAPPPPSLLAPSTDGLDGSCRARGHRRRGWP